MSLKFKVLNELKENRGCFVSGQYLADKFNVSRGAVWKSIKSIRDEGYKIESVTNKGYSIVSENDVISEDEIKYYLKEYSNDINIIIYDSVDSTNNMLKRMFIDGIPNNTLIIADEQTNGKGRFGRSFYSPAKTGLYFSLLIKPELDTSTAVLITGVIAVAICRAIETLTGKHPGIKWINDIYMDNKKIAGILTEASSGFESGKFDYIIIGVGINLSTDNFPDELAEIAGSLNSDISKNQLIGDILYNFYKIYYSLPDTEYMKEYRKYSILINHDISYNIENVTYSGKVIGIDDSGGLIISNSNGITTLKSGEVTIIDF
ncbi:MAG: biotin--[acetyl-CoA-carboxylase] ligase [Lachnospiraceae bacterium]|nr:biotin--[acetyl-CoA-carboxylase] ligase [Lachnospiraceae bacterium]